ncbi:MAG: substrate-binding domain-containing protein, partial [Clostridia bacterium]|nr:substrate-binding domain-containing protein [Clostridia bacterium]
NILEITLPMGSTDAQNRHAGFHDTLGEYDNFTIISQDGKASATEAQSIVQNVLLSEDIDVIYCHYDLMARGSLLGVQQSGYVGNKDIKIVTCDCDYEDMDLMKTGEGLSACVTVSPKDGVPIMLDAVKAYFNGETLEPEYIVKETLVTMDNVDELYDQVGY